MGYSSTINDMIDEKIMSVHTSYLAKVLSVNGDTAKIQPLGNVKAYGQAPQAQSVLSNVPILRNARYKLSAEEITYVDSEGQTATKTVIVPAEIAAGDTVMVACCERDISDSKNGINSTPVVGHHSMSDSVIIGIL